MFTDVSNLLFKHTPDTHTHTHSGKTSGVVSPGSQERSLQVWIPGCSCSVAAKVPPAVALVSRSGTTPTQSGNCGTLLSPLLCNNLLPRSENKTVSPPRRCIVNTQSSRPLTSPKPGRLRALKIAARRRKLLVLSRAIQKESRRESSR